MYWYCNTNFFFIITTNYEIYFVTMSKLNRFRNKRIFLILLIVIIALFFMMDSCRSNINVGWMTSLKITKESVQIECYEYKIKNILQELVAVEVTNSSIFFVETSCHVEAFNINPRQACAIESAAKMNPNVDVYLLVPSPVTSLDGMHDPLKRLTSYTNFKLRYINMTTFFLETPLADWYKSGLLKSSYWPQSHTSDILRYTLLWKYGGIYMDLDVVIMQSLEHMTNFAGAESSNNVAAGVMSFSHNHKISWLAMNDLRNNFRGYDWGWNGPGVITRALREYCGTCQVKQMIENGCKDFTVFAPYAFYPIQWENWSKYFTFNKQLSSNVLDEVKNSYAIHVWNKHSIKANISVGSNQPYGIIAEKYCPIVYSSVKEIF